MPTGTRSRCTNDDAGNRSSFSPTEDGSSGRLARRDSCMTAHKYHGDGVRGGWHQRCRCSPAPDGCLEPAANSRSPPARSPFAPVARRRRLTMESTTPRGVYRDTRGIEIRTAPVAMGLLTPESTTRSTTRSMRCGYAPTRLNSVPITKASTSPTSSVRGCGPTLAEHPSSYLLSRVRRQGRRGSGTRSPCARR